MSRYTTYEQSQIAEAVQSLRDAETHLNRVDDDGGFEVLRVRVCIQDSIKELLKINTP